GCGRPGPSGGRGGRSRLPRPRRAAVAPPPGAHRRLAGQRRRRALKTKERTRGPAPSCLSAPLDLAIRLRLVTGGAYPEPTSAVQPGGPVPVRKTDNLRLRPGRAPRTRVSPAAGRRGRG